MAGTVTVACKLPTGYRLQVYDMADTLELVMGGGSKVVKRAVKSGQSIKLNGFAQPFGTSQPHIRHGVGLTHGVDADLFARWLDQHKEDALVTGGFIYASAKPAEVEAQARDRVSLKSGLEPTDPANLPDEFKKKIKTTTTTT